MFYSSDIAVAIIALVCLALSVSVVSNSHISWYLGASNRQLIVIGFLLSIISLCLASVTPTFFILLEARFGQSTIQNYDAILRNKPLASSLSFVWRVILVVMLSLPIGLSVAYKTFAGGESNMSIQALDYFTNATYFGLFAPPGIVSVTGISTYLNATTSFRDATQRAADGSEPPLPTFPQPYGYNILLLNESSAASLDLLHPDYILAIQNLLAAGESWTITAPVIGTVATFNESATNNRTAFDEDFESICTDGLDKKEKWEMGMVYLYNAWSFFLASQISKSDQSIQYVGFSQKRPAKDCPNYAPHAHLFNIYRQPCLGTWSISRGGFELLSGSCDNTILPWAKQQIIQYRTLALKSWYMPSLIEMMTTFSGTNITNKYRSSQSHWMRPYMTVSVANMLWSRLSSVELTLTNAPFDAETFNKSSIAWRAKNGTNITHEDAGMMYAVDEDDQLILFNRPTLQKSFWLYLVLAIQPALLLVILGMIALFHSFPLSKGFGLISILSGIESRSLNSLGGASLSGELVRPVKLVMIPSQGSETSSIQYHIATSSKEIQGNERLARNVVYH
ncbi:hypothetical protein CKAH01_18606 [Colletotrichum kahawae]|uniref:Uncharacterized protein n=1 Tax=Colletotrichum kahawae TaxID=34407 RepID=A0AAE0D262_COLKA|nr:hypothetical protein CKAH01_18606 [Colletotrichum kahawae]